MDALADFIDLERYPIDNLESCAGRTLIESCQAMMRERASCALKGFLRPVFLQEISDEVTQLESEMRRVDFPATPYGWLKNTGFSKTHPRSRVFDRRCGVLTRDQLDSKGPVSYTHLTLPPILLV